MAQKHNQKQIWINLEQWESLSKISSKTHIPMAALVRIALETYLDRKEATRETHE